jgi:hypothetical protein
MGEIVRLRNTPIDINSDLGHAFVTDCTRAAEGLITDKELAEKWELNPADWRAITKSKELGRAIRSERERRVRSGLAVREASAKALIKGPGILDSIMSGVDSHPKHKIEAFRELRQTASVGADAEGRPESERFIIRIDLSSDGTSHVENFDKPRAPIKIDVSSDDEKKTDDE